MRNIKKKIQKEIKTKPFDQYFDYEENNLSKQKEVKLQESIGKLFMSFSFVEQDLNDALCSLINDRADSVGVLIIRKMFFKQKLNIYKDMVSDFIRCVGGPTKSKKLLNKTDSVIKKAEELSEFRNDIAHADWTTLDKDNFVTISIEIDNKKEEGVHYKKMKITPGIIIKYVRQNEALQDKFNELREDLYNLLN